MFELYIDLVTIFMTDQCLPDSRTGNAQTNLCCYMMQGTLYNKLKETLGVQGRTVKLEIQQRFQEIIGTI